MAIREADTGDIKGLMSLIRSNTDIFGEFEIPVAEKSICGLVKNNSKEHKFFVAVDSEKMVR